MKLVKLTIFALLLGCPWIASAGTVQPALVTVDMEFQVARGDMSSARWEKGDSSFIGCGIRTIDNGFPFEWGFCQASDSDGVRIICQTQSPTLLGAIKSSSDGSYIQFTWNESEECTAIGVSTQSFYINKDNPSFVNKLKDVTP